jgi:hypothetical protein
MRTNNYSTAHPRCQLNGCSVRLSIAVLCLWVLASGAAASGFIEGGAVEQWVEHPGPLARVVIDVRYLDVDISGTAESGVRARATVSNRLQRRNAFRLLAEPSGDLLAIRFSTNSVPLATSSISWSPRLTVAVPSAAEVVVRTTSGDVLVTSVSGQAGAYGKVFVRTRDGMVVLQDSHAQVALVSESGALTVRRTIGDVHVASATGDITLAEIAGDVPAQNAAGYARFTNIGGSIVVASQDRVTFAGSNGSWSIDDPGLPLAPIWARAER